MKVQFTEHAQYDFDHAYGSQCVDLFRVYCSKLGVAQCPPVIGAIDIFDKWPTSPFAKVTGLLGVQPGDVVFKRASSTNPYGHVAIVKSVAGTITVVEQNGFTQKGLEVKEYLSTIWCGYLRPLGFDGIEIEVTQSTPAPVA